MKRWLKLNKHSLLGLGSAAAVVTAAALGILTIRHDGVSGVKEWSVPDVTRADLDNAWRLAEAWTVAPEGRVQAGILPHHVLVSPIMAGWFAGLKNQPVPTTVVVIGPDHQDRGAGYLTTAVTDWRTPDGVLKINRDLVSSLRWSGDVVLDEVLIRTEHGVYTALPYIHRTWPAARVVTMAVKSDERPDRLARLAQRLDVMLQPNDLVLATVDFSHYTTAIDALRADATSLDVIRRGDAMAALSIPVDSPSAISLLLTWAQRRALRYQQIAHTTSAQFTGTLDAPSTTSYVSAYFWASAP